MKKAAVALAVVLALGLAALIGFQSFGFQLFGVSWVWDKEKAQLARLAQAFLQDLQFKDFDKAGKYHELLDQGKADIPKLIERLFQVKPELLNIRDFEITDIKLDSDGKRARTFFRSNLEFLNTAEGDKPNKEKQVEGILYWHKRPAAPGEAEAPADGSDPAALAEQWFMKLESSLH
ncbi:MAG: hypothetical protein KF878_19945 [Planctomycetes bacterium]|nr:hypothetical protein [Planctomycetota bacterium]